MSELDPIIDEFLVESCENLDQLDRDLVDLEQNPTEESLLASIFRTIHTIKRLMDRATFQGCLMRQG